VTAITHSGSGAITLDFSTTDVGFDIAVGAAVTDVTISNGAASGEVERRILILTADGTHAFAMSSIDNVDSAVPSELTVAGGPYIIEVFSKGA